MRDLFDILFNLYIVRREDLPGVLFTMVFFTTWHTTHIPVLIYHSGNDDGISANKFEPLKSGKLGGIRSLQ